MPKIKIFLEPGESELDADLSLMKALEFQTSGEAHDTENFSDPAMADTLNRLDSLYSKIYADMIREIAEALDAEYSRGNQ